MKNIVFARAIGLACVVFFAQPAQLRAQESRDAIVQECRLALEEANNVVRDGRNASIKAVLPIDLSELYSDYPADAPLGALLRIQGRSATHIMESPQFMRTISTRLINRCRPLSSVTFQLDQTDWEATFGLINNQVVPFDCVDLGLLTELDWGETFCL